MKKHFFILYTVLSTIFLFAKTTIWIPVINDTMMIMIPFSTFDKPNQLKIPDIPNYSQGALVVQCEEDVVYYIMAFRCYRSDTDPFVLTEDGNVIVEEKGETEKNIFYTKGYIERTDQSVIAIDGKVYSGGEVGLATWPKVCVYDN
jgi:hypothetical protein